MKKADLIEWCGSISKTAERFNVTYSNVWQWPDPLPKGVAYQAEVLSGGVLRVDPSVYVKPAKSIHDASLKNVSALNKSAQSDSQRTNG
jgi:hypothetical protein